MIDFVQSCLTKASESCGTEECSVSKDEDDDDNDDDDEKGLPGYNCDPERLKAFNVSVFVIVSCEMITCYVTMTCNNVFYWYYFFSMTHNSVHLQCMMFQSNEKNVLISVSKY